MGMETEDLDRLQQTYTQAVDEWVTKIRQEEALAAGADHSVISLDGWEQASLEEGKARDKVRAAKKQYEEALRRKYFNF
jgi:hypothetical protein